MEVLIFKVNKTAFGIDTKQVIEIVNKLEISKTPELSGDDSNLGVIDGLVNVREEIIKQIGLEKLLFNNENKSASLSIICRTENKNYISLRVEEIVRLYNVKDTELIPTDGMISSVDNLVYSYINLKNNMIVQLLDVDSIIKRINS